MTSPPVVQRPVTGARPAYVRPVISEGVQPRARRVLIYGPGGSGKSQLESLVPGILVFDLEGSTSHLDIKRLDLTNAGFADVRAMLQDKELLAPYKAVGIDTLTALEEKCVAHTLATVPHEKGHTVTSIEGYGFGKGLQHNFDTFLPLLADLDRIIESGKHVFLLAHECTNDTPNPEGDDFLRYEPRLQQPKSGKASIRDRVFEWCDVVGYLSYDVSAKDGKGKGAGTRTVYFSARPSWRAKGRGTFPKSIPWNDPNNASEVLKCLSN